MSDALISDYLGRLDAAAWPLPASRRSELTAEVREHIETALTEAGLRDETTVRNVLDRLGRPEDIVAAEVEGDGARRGPAGAPLGARAGQATSDWLARASVRGWGPLEIAAVLLLVAGTFLLWWAGPMAGAALALFSDRWTTREKRVAAFSVFGLLVLDVVLLLTVMGGMFSFNPFGGGIGFSASFGLIAIIALVAAILPWIAGLAAGIYLALAIQRRAQG